MYKYKGNELLSPGSNEIAHEVAMHCDAMGLSPAEQQLCIDTAVHSRYTGSARAAAIVHGKSHANSIRFQRAHASQFDSDDVISSRRWRLGLAFAIVVAMALLLTSYGLVHS